MTDLSNPKEYRAAVLKLAMSMLRMSNKANPKVAVTAAKVVKHVTLQAVGGGVAIDNFSDYWLSTHGKEIMEALRKEYGNYVNSYDSVGRVLVLNRRDKIRYALGRAWSHMTHFHVPRRYVKATAGEVLNYPKWPVGKEVLGDEGEKA